MPLAALTYDIKPGYENEIAQILVEFKRVTSPVVLGADGQEAARILATAVFIRGATMVRFIEYDGNLDAVARHMATQSGVREVEERLVPYLAVPRNTATVEGFVATFRGSLMRCISQLSAASRQVQ
jgi:hypothetical protein